MNKELTAVLKTRLEAGGGLDFIDVYSGLVSTVSRTIQDANGSFKIQRFPVSYDTSVVDCGRSPEKALTPDSTKKGLLYFEENGNVIPGRRLSSGFYQYKSGLALVVWINRKKVTGGTYDELTKTALGQIQAKISTPVPGEVGFQNLIVKTEFIRQDASIFSRYTYDETVTQYLRPPFEFFAIGITVSFYSRAACAPELILNPDNC